MQEIRNEDHSLFERGRGNVVSVEVSNASIVLPWLIFTLQFNSLYRWHATTSEADEQWTQKVFGELFGGKPVDEITVNDYRQVAAKIEQMQPDNTRWTFGG